MLCLSAQHKSWFPRPEGILIADSPDKTKLIGGSYINISQTHNIIGPKYTNYNQLSTWETFFIDAINKLIAHLSNTHNNGHNSNHLTTTTTRRHITFISNDISLKINCEQNITQISNHISKFITAIQLLVTKYNFTIRILCIRLNPYTSLIDDSLLYLNTILQRLVTDTHSNRLIDFVTIINSQAHYDSELKYHLTKAAPTVQSTMKIATVR